MRALIVATLLVSACAGVPRPSQPLDGARCRAFIVEEERTLGPLPSWAGATLRLDGAGNPHVVWTRLREANGALVTLYTHAVERSGRWIVEEDILSGEPTAAPFHLERDGNRMALVVGGLGAGRPPRLFTGPPWRLAGPVPSTRVASDATGRLYAVTWQEQQLRLLRRVGDRFEPAAAVDAPGPPPGDYYLQRHGQGLLLFYQRQGAPRPPLEALLLTGLAGPAPAQRRLSPTETDPLREVEVTRDTGQRTEGCPPLPTAGRTCRIPSQSLRFHRGAIRIDRPGETVVAGSEWTERGPARWRDPVCGNDQGPVGWRRELFRTGEGRLLLARVAPGRPPCLHTVTLARASDPEQSLVAVATDPAGRLHVLWRSGDRLRYVRLRD